MSTEPSYFNAYENFSLTRTAAGVLTVRLHTNGGPITFTGATHSQFPRVLEDIAFDRDNQVMVLTGTGDSFMDAIDGPSLGDLTKPMGADVEYMEGRRIVQRLVDGRTRRRRDRRRRSVQPPGRGGGRRWSRPHGHTNLRRRVRRGRRR